MGKKAKASSPPNSTALPTITEAQLVQLSFQELRGMDLRALLDTLQQLGYSTETITTKTQALTRLADNAIEAVSLDDEKA